MLKRFASRTEDDNSWVWQIGTAAAREISTRDAAVAKYFIGVDKAAVDLAMCDAHLLELPHVGAPERARTEVPPATWRAVWRRDHGQCVVPGCRAAKYLDVHHIVHRSDSAPPTWDRESIEWWERGVPS